MYYIIRVFLLLIVFVCLYFALKRKKATKSIHTGKAVIIKLIVIVLIAAIVFIPFESPFIRFDSAEASVNYSTLNFNNPIKTVETENTAFCVSHTRNNFSYHTVTKYDDKYGFCDRKAQNDLGFEHIVINNETFQGSVDIVKMIDYETNEKCYMISILNVLDYVKDKAEDYYIHDEQNKRLEKLVFADNMAVFALVVEQLDKSSTIKFYGQTYELD